MIFFVPGQTRISATHRWDVSPKEAVAIQRQWCAKAVRRDQLGAVQRVAGMDAHPRRFGLASHFGVLTDTPSIGVAKTRLIGEHAPVPAQMGAWTLLGDRDEIIGAALRTRRGVKPLYVSVGHRVCLETALRLVMSCVTKYR